MNIFTRFLAGRRRDSEIAEFIERWDALEALVIRIYKTRRCDEEDARAYQEIAGWLREAHGEWAGRLRPYWQETMVDGRPAKQDPFAALFSPASAEAFVGNWAAMQQLPAAREALNKWLLATDSSDRNEGK